jgi:predicted small integral membrane protein
MSMMTYSAVSMIALVLWFGSLSGLLRGSVSVSVHILSLDFVAPMKYLEYEVEEDEWQDEEVYWHVVVQYQDHGHRNDTCEHVEVDK